MDRFSTELTYTEFSLIDARRILMTSFFSHKTISFLDLQITERDIGFFLFPFYSKKSFFCTEESFRNHLVPKRRLLYTLNLDVPDRREYNHLRNGPVQDSLPFNRGSLFAVVKDYNFYKITLSWFLKSGFKRTNCKMKLVRWIFGFRPLESCFIPVNVLSDCAITLFRECEDPEFALRFFSKFLHFRAFLETGESKVLENFLHHARICDFDIRIQLSDPSSLTDYCILNLGFSFVHSCLKYENTVYYTAISYEIYKKFLLSNLRSERIGEEEINRPENAMSQLRLYRILQILHISERHAASHRSEASEALRLIWSSIPDCFVPLQEMSEAYGHLLPSEYIGRAHSYYEEAICETVSCREPRRLTHYCRTVLRKMLYDAKQWLPDGIERLNLPPRIESFLNLQTDHLKPENFQAP